SFLEGFYDENPQVQSQLLTAIVKLFLNRSTDTQKFVQVLSLATQDSDNLNLRYQLTLLVILFVYSRNGQISMDMTFTNKLMQPMSGFAIQLNKNSLSLMPAPGIMPMGLGASGRS
ncbi:hypothetical protein PV325_013805, partial [Microctonus aethiopoides]